jgi:membrane-associated protease RseP (regulator of RpoE activity)
VNGAEIFGIVILSFWALVYLLKGKLEKKGFQIYPFLLLWRKDTRSEWFPSLASSKFYKIFEKIAVALGILSMIGGITLILYVLITLLIPKPQQVEATQPRLEPIIPGLTIGLNQVPELLLAIGISVTLHELAHAISATSNKTKVKGGGFLLLIFFPGAFVEPDEDEFNKSKTISKLKIISAGIAVNLILAAIFFPLAYFLPPLLSQGVQIVGEAKNYPAYNASIPVNSVILSVNGHRITQPQQLGYYLKDSTTLSNTITFLFPNGSIVTKIINVTKDHLLGVYVTYYFPPALYFILDFFTWMFTVNFSLALINGAPLIITDGGKVFTELMKKVGLNDKQSYVLQTIILILFIGAILLSINPPQ